MIQHALLVCVFVFVKYYLNLYLYCLESFAGSSSENLLSQPTQVPLSQYHNPCSTTQVTLSQYQNPSSHYIPIVRVLLHVELGELCLLLIVELLVRVGHCLPTGPCATIIILCTLSSSTCCLIYHKILNHCSSIIQNHHPKNL